MLKGEREERGRKKEWREREWVRDQGFGEREGMREDFQGDGDSAHTRRSIWQR